MRHTIIDKPNRELVEIRLELVLTFILIIYFGSMMFKTLKIT